MTDSTRSVVTLAAVPKRSQPPQAGAHRSWAALDSVPFDGWRA
jgi:hypothetical protein